jgi:molecular chaperone GrpE (heat shock protein)
MNNDNYNYDIMLSRTVSRLIRKLLDAVYEGEDEENRMSFSDKELIDDVIRFGTLKDVAKHKNVHYATLVGQWERIIFRLEKKTNIMEHKNFLINKANCTLRDPQLKSKIAELQTQIKELKIENRKKCKELRDNAMKCKEEAEEYRKQYKAAQKTADELRQYNDRLQRAYDRLIQDDSIGKKPGKNKYRYMRILALENMLMRFKTEGTSALKDFEPKIRGI